MFGVFFQFSTPIPQDPLPQSFFSEQQPEVVVDFDTSLLAHFIILFPHQRDGRDDDDDVFCHTVLLHWAEPNSLCFEACQRTCLVKCCDFFFLLTKASLTACFIPQSEPELVFHGTCSFFLTNF